MSARSDYLKVLRWGGVAVLSLVLLAAGASWAMIEWGIVSAKRSAEAQFPGRDASQALIDLVNCEKCAIEQRNRAVWTLGQIREQRALPVLHKHFYNGPCNHEKFICQHELRKALKRIEDQPRDHAWRWAMCTDSEHEAAVKNLLCSTRAQTTYEAVRLELMAREAPQAAL